MSLNGAKNNPKIVTKITAVRPKGGGSHKPPPLNTPLSRCYITEKSSISLYLCLSVCYLTTLKRKGKSQPILNQGDPRMVMGTLEFSKRENPTPNHPHRSERDRASGLQAGPQSRYGALSTLAGGTGCPWRIAATNSSKDADAIRLIFIHHYLSSLFTTRAKSDTSDAVAQYKVAD